MNFLQQQAIRQSIRSRSALSIAKMRKLLRYEERRLISRFKVLQVIKIEGEILSK